jgi:membrane associated rhomboid family serine protease
MWFLWIFGNNVEEAYGNLGYLAIYVASGLVATAAFVVANPDAVDPLVGASGAIAGILGAYLVLFPTHKVLSLFFVFFVPIPAVLFLGLWFASQFGIQDSSVAWEAHVGGFLFGVLLTLPLRSFLLRRVDALHAAPVYRP